MSISKQLLALALGACLAAPASAQESLIEVYQRALMNDPAIREAEATYLATAEVKPQARSALLPRLNLGATRAAPLHRYGGSASSIRLRARAPSAPAEFEQDSTGYQLSLDAIGFRLEPVQDAGASRQARRTRRDRLPSGAAGSHPACGGRLLQRPCRRRQSRVGRRGTRQRVPAARAVATAFRGRLDRHHGRAAITGRLRRCRRRSRSRRKDCCRLRTSSSARSSARSCRSSRHRWTTSRC